MNKILYTLLLIIPLNVSGQFYYAESDTTYNGIYFWTLDKDFAKIDADCDTTMTGIQVYNPVYQMYSPMGAEHAGNIGLASRSRIFSDRIQSDFTFGEIYRPYLMAPEDLKYYNAKKPFSQLFFTESLMPSVEENIFNVFHTQNVNKNLNFGINGKVIASEGQYINQKTEHYSFAPYLSYVKNRTSIHAAFLRNRLKLHDNGGTKIDSLTLSTNSIPVYLENTKSKVSNKRYYFVGTYGIGKKVNNLTDTTGNSISNIYFSDISYEFDYNEYYRTYVEDGFEDTIYNKVSYYNKTKTYDSVYFRKIKNTIQYRFNEKPSKKYKFSGRVAFTFETNKYRYNGDTLLHIEEINTTTKSGIDTTYYKQTPDIMRGLGYTNTYLLVSLYNRTSKSWNWEFTGQQHVTGEFAGDINMHGNISRIFRFKNDSLKLTLRGAYKSETPNYFWQEYQSNHFRWENNFDKTNTTAVGGTIDLPGFGSRIDGSLKMISNYKYFGTDKLPKQHNKEVGVLTLKYDQHLKFFNWHFNNKITYQKVIGDDIIRVPDVILYSSLYYDKVVFNKAARFQGGFDFMMHTKYFADGYMPSYNGFHLQNKEEIGMYPYLDIFLSLKIRQAILFTKVENVLSFQTGGNGIVNRNYYLMPEYPDNEFRWRIGIKWTLFY